ncbi:MAG: PAS domain-containing sensor histidine kinase [Gemmatimonadota bacterium]
MSTPRNDVSIHNHRALFESAPDGILVVNADGTIVDANPEAVRLFGYDRRDLVGMSVDALVPTGAGSSHAEQRERYLANPVRRPMGIGMELRARREDGTTFPAEISLSQSHLDGSDYTIATVRDVSIRHRLRDFGAGALRATEDVRARIARDLHDDTAQQLAAHMVRLRLLEMAATEEERAEHIRLLREGLEATTDSIRRIARGLRPPELEDAGLMAALRAHARRLGESHRLQVTLEGEAPDTALTLDGRLVVYRIVQEALTNVARHAGTDRAHVEIRIVDGTIEVEVSDEGKGFKAHAVEPDGRGLGLLGMQERAAMVRGRLEVDSRPGKGTMIRLWVPVQVDREVQRV